MSKFNVHVPEQPTWRMFVALMALFFLGSIVGLMAISSLHSDTETIHNAQLVILANQDAGKERGYINRSVECMSVVVDNDRTFPLTETCLDPAVAAYYPPQVCNKLPAPIEGCGGKLNNEPPGP